MATGDFEPKTLIVGDMTAEDFAELGRRSGARRSNGEGYCFKDGSFFTSNQVYFRALRTFAQIGDRGISLTETGGVIVDTPLKNENGSTAVNAIELSKGKVSTTTYALPDEADVIPDTVKEAARIATTTRRGRSFLRQGLTEVI